jgi:ATP-dependent exoDNAse (exonuclease V) beta subunit
MTVTTPRERDRLCAQSWDLADAFLNSSFARELLRNAREGTVHCEYPFLLQAGEPALYLNGKIDLLVEREDSVTVVDFKTDQAVEPEHYTAQMAVYRHAAAALFDKPATVWLFFLRTAEAFDTTEAIRHAGDIHGILATIDLPENGRGGVDLAT